MIILLSNLESAIVAILGYIVIPLAALAIIVAGIALIVKEVFRKR